MKTKIDYVHYSWNVVTGCYNNPVIIRQGCKNCYARELANNRLKGRFGYPDKNPFTWTFHPDKLEMPLKIKKPSKFLLPSMGDLFANNANYSYIIDIFRIIIQCPQHRFLILTKFMRNLNLFINNIWKKDIPENIWFGITIEDQNILEIDLDKFIRFPSKNLWLSMEPILSDITIPNIAFNFIKWVVIGGESGWNARPYHPEWIFSIISECQHNKIPVYLKQYGSWIPESPINANAGFNLNAIKWVAIDKMGKTLFFPDDNIKNMSKNSYFMGFITPKNRSKYEIFNESHRQFPNDLNI